MRETSYKWDNPYQWLMEYAAKLDSTALFQEFSVIAGKLDSDTIQDLYQADMDSDGYFTPVVTGICECADAGCKAHSGMPACKKVGHTLLYRVDMEDRTGTLFCEECAEDASDSGLFTDSADLASQA